ncbi:MAG1360 family OppF-related protein [Mycoplasmopsis felifaucium]|uniref:MAG1360 family OppF-related protein n=1 Tax=Mycoplasmopsis felifaucium TaxID=35768 RepID=UPI000481A48B|nr:hypothetical protein [Mycoplasmopsis felifaucium]
MNIDKIKNKNIVLSINNLNVPAKNENPIHISSINICELEKAAIFISDNSKGLLNNNFWKILNNQTNNGIVSFTKNKNNFEILKNKNVLKEIDFFNMNVFEELEGNIPLFSLFEDINNNFWINSSVINDYEKIFNEQLNKLKLILFYSLEKFVDSLYVSTISARKAVNNFSKFFENNSKNLPLLENGINELKLNFEEFVLNVLQNVFDSFRSFNSKFEILFSAYKKYIEYTGSPDLPVLRHQYTFMKKIKNPTVINVKKHLAIRDNEAGIKILKNILVNNKNNSLKLLKLWIEILKNDVNTYKKVLKDNANDLIITLHMNRKISLIKSAIKVLDKNQFKLAYLSEDNIFELIYNIKHEINFICNSELKNSIKQDQTKIKSFAELPIWTFNINNWISISNQNKSVIENNIVQNKLNIKNLKKQYFNIHDDQNFSITIKNLANKIDRTVNEKKFQNANSEELLLERIKKNKRIFSELPNSWDIWKTIHTAFKAILNSKSLKKYKRLDLQDNISYLYKLSDIAISLISELINLKNIVFDKKNSEISNIKQFYLFSSFINIFDRSNMQVEDLLKTYNSSSKINKLKLGLISKLVQQPKLIIIEDFSNRISSDLRNELLEVCDDLTQLTETATLLITNNIETLKYKKVDYVYVFSNNFEFEHGKYETILNHPVSPKLKKLFLNIDFKNDYVSEQNSLIKDEYKIGENHYLTASLDEYSNWTNQQNDLLNKKPSKRSLTKKDSAKNLEQTQLISPFMDDEVFISNFNKRNMPQITDQKLFAELESHTNHEGNMIQINDEDSSY